MELSESPIGRLGTAQLWSVLRRCIHMAYIRTNSSDVLKGADEEILLSVVVVLDHDEEGVQRDIYSKKDSGLRENRCW